MSYECSKCNGTGEIPAHRNVFNGVCFKCHGTGKQERKPVAKSQKWLCKYDGVGLFTKPARSEAEALRKAVGHWKCNPHAPALVNITDASQISVEECV